MAVSDSVKNEAFIDIYRLRPSIATQLVAIRPNVTSSIKPEAQ